VFVPYARDLRALRAELDGFGQLLRPGTPLGEAEHILPYVRESRHLAAAFGFANRALGAPDLLAVEKPLLGSFRCDVAVGSLAARQFTLVELEDARENSVFQAVRGRRCGCCTRSESPARRAAWMPTRMRCLADKTSA